MKAPAIIITTVAAAGALALVALLAAQRAASFWSDAGAIATPPDAPVRHILWLPSRPVAGVNTSADEYEPKFSPDGTTMIIVRRKPGHNADLFTSRWSPSGWSDPAPLDAVNTDADELGPELSSDARSLYFYSDRSGGKGGYDLWVSHHVDGEWSTPQNLGDSINTEFNEYAPALSPDRRTLYFSSNRPREGEPVPATSPWSATMRERAARHDYDLYAANVTDDAIEPARPLGWANTPRDEGSPAVSPAGDFLYFSSNREGGLGGYDLYRARINDPRHRVIENLGDAVNSPDNELDPALSADGFRLTFSSDRRTESDASGPALPPTSPAASAPPASSSTLASRDDRDYNLWSTAAREVFLDHRPVAAKLVQWLDAAWPWLLVLALLALLLWLLSRLVRSELWRRRMAQMSLLARCLLISLLVHALVASLLAIWRVGSYLGDLMHSGGTRVVLASAATDLNGDIASQFSTAIESPDAPGIAPTTPALQPVRLDSPSIETTLDSRSLPDSATPIAPRSIEPSPSDDSLAPSLTPTLVAQRPPDSSQPAPALPRVEAPSPSSPEASLQAPAIAARSLPLASNELSANISSAPLPPRAPNDQAALTPSPTTDAARTPTADPFAAPTPSDAPISPIDPVSIAALPETSRAQRVSEPGADASRPSLAPPTIPTPSAAPAPRINDTRLAARETPRAEPVLARDVLPSLDRRDDSSTQLAPPTSVLTLAPREHTTDAALPPSARPQATPTPPREHAPEGSPAATLPRSTIDLPLTSIEPPSPATLPATGLAPRPINDAPAAAPLTPSHTDLSRAEPSHSLVAEPTPPTALAGPLTQPTQQTSLPTLPPELPQPVEDFAQRAPEQRSDLLEKMGGSQETELAVARALEWLKRAQEPDGRWSSKNNGGEVNADTAMTGMAMLCFLSAGHTHTADGPYRDTVARAIRHLVSQQSPDGNLAGDETMYGQTIASVALCEAYAMTHDAKLARPVKLAVDYVDASARANDGSAGKTSVLGWQVMAMESARRAGVKTSNITFDAARRWLDSVASPASPGRYAYQRAGAPSPAMTAEAMFVQQMLGRAPTDPRMQDSASFILASPPRWRDGAPTHYWYYATLALFQHQGTPWKQWNDALVPELLSHQQQTGPQAGSWEPQDRWSKLCGRVHQTAVCTLSLEVYYRYRAPTPMPTPFPAPAATKSDRGQ